MEYLKTAKQTAKKNGMICINSKLIADFSAVKRLINDNSNTINSINSINVSAENIYSRFEEAITNEFRSKIFAFSDIAFIHFRIDNISFSIDIINSRTSVYYDGARKYVILIPDAIRIRVYKGNDAIMYFEYQPEKFNDNFHPVFEIDIA